MTGDALFHALRRLLGRLDSTTTQSSHDRIGTQHIRSLFCTTAAEAANLVSLAFGICDEALKSRDGDRVEGRESWIETIASIWNLHLQGPDDTLGVATHLFSPCASILNKLQGADSDGSIREPLRAKWMAHTQKFMQRNLILPARALFIARQDFEAMDRALHVSEASIDVAAPTLYFLASGVADYLGEGRLRKGNGDWMKRVFKAVELSIRDRDDRDNLIRRILERAAKQSMLVDNDDLRFVCREYALHEGNTNWGLVADISTCDADVFQLSKDGASLLKEVCERSTSSKLSEVEAEAISRTIGSILRGFRTGRDISGFLKLWFKQLCKVEKQQSKSSPWLLVGTKQYGNDHFSALIEKDMSPQQTVELLRWLEAEKSHSRSLCLFLNSVAQGIRTETYCDAVGRKLFDLVSDVPKSSSTLTAFKWGVVSKTLSWVVVDERTEIWASVKKQLSKILTDAPIASRETFESFKCCCQAWVSMHPDDGCIDEPVKLVEEFTARLAAEVMTSGALKGQDLSTYLGSDAEPAYLEEAALENYLAWFLRGSSRLNRLFYGSKGAMPKTLQNALAPNGNVDQLKAVWGSLLTNENNLNDAKVMADLIDRLTKSLEEDGSEKRWPADRSQAWMRVLSRIPTDAFTRPQREQIMLLLHKHRANTKKRVSVGSWNLILGLSTKLMARSTFYEGLSFSDNVEIADAMLDLSSATSTDDGTLGDLIQVFFIMASTTIRLMAEHIEDRSLKYFQQSREFVADCDNAGDLSPFRLTLLKALVVETTKSPNCQSHPDLASLSGSARDMLGRCIVDATGYFIKEKKAYEDRSVTADLRLLAAVDAAEVLETLDKAAAQLKQADVRKAEKRSRAAMLAGDLRGWKMQTFLRTYFSSAVEDARPTTFHSLDDLPAKFRESLLTSNVVSVIRDMDTAARISYLEDLIRAFGEGSDTSGQALAIQTVVSQLLGKHMSYLPPAL